MFSSQKSKTDKGYWESSGEEDGAAGLGFVRTDWIRQKVINKIFSQWDQLIQKQSSRASLRTVLGHVDSLPEPKPRTKEAMPTSFSEAPSGRGSPEFTEPNFLGSSGSFVEATAG